MDITLAAIVQIRRKNKMVGGGALSAVSHAVVAREMPQVIVIIGYV